MHRVLQVAATIVAVALAVATVALGWLLIFAFGGIYP